MARPSNWTTPTTAIRIPAHLADLLITYAKTLEEIEQPDPLDDGYRVGQKVYSKTRGSHYGRGFGIIDHLTPFAVYVLWIGEDESNPIINWKERHPSCYSRRFCTENIQPVQEPLQLSIA